MSKPLNGRLAELALIAERGAEVVYGGQGWVKPNRWISNAIIADFLERGLIEQKDKRVRITQKGLELCERK